jgi:hypothetical protein
MVFPGAGFADLAADVGETLGCPMVEELTILAPLTVPEHGAVRLQVTVGAVNESGARALSVYTSAEDDEQEWTCHARGVLTSEAVKEVAAGAQWPPADATPVDVDEFYDRASGIGFSFGPEFRGIRSAWRRDAEALADVGLAPTTDAAGFGVHPALLDAALQVSGFVPAFADGPGRLPFSFHGLRVHAKGARAMRVTVTPSGPDAVTVAAHDAAGRLVVTVASLTLRPVDSALVARASQVGDGMLLATRWRAVGPDAASAADARGELPYVLGPLFIITGVAIAFESIAAMFKRGRAPKPGAQAQAPT